MVEVFSSSFIPKGDFTPKKKKRSNFQIDILLLLSIIILLSVISILIFLYFWKSTLVHQIEKDQKVLEEKQEQYALKSIKDFSDLDKRIRVGDKLLRNHFNIIPIFDFLENRTHKDVVISTVRIDEVDNNISVNIEGVARDLETLELQSKLYMVVNKDELRNLRNADNTMNNNPAILNLVVSNIVNDKGLYRFTMEFEINKENLTNKEFTI